MKIDKTLTVKRLEKNFRPDVQVCNNDGLQFQTIYKAQDTYRFRKVF